MFKKLIKKLSKARKGFTLVELIVVMAILGILASIAIPTFAGVSARAKVKADIATANSIIHEARAIQEEAGNSTPILLSTQGLTSIRTGFTVTGGGTAKYVVSFTEANTVASNAVDVAGVIGFVDTAGACVQTEQ